MPSGAPGTGKASVRAGGIHAVGIITVVLMVAVAGFIGYQTNRVAPASASVDSGWRSWGGGDTGDLTSYLRGEGFRCSDDERPDGTFRRVCADYTPENPRYVELAGSTTDGDAHRVYIQMDPERENNLEVATRAANAVVPDGGERPEVAALLQSGPESEEVVEGPWGVAGYTPNGVFMASSDSSAQGANEARFVDAPPGHVENAAHRAGYQCESEPLSCTRAGDDGSSWQLDLSDAGLTLSVQTNDPESVDVVAEIEALLPPSEENEDIRSWLDSVPTDRGRAGLWRGHVLDYRVDEPTSTITMRAGTTCHPVHPAENEPVC